jgi:molybdopterin-guanine dinucleotide biosynthesis protein B
MPPIISIVGRRNSGKTTVLEALISELTGRGLSVGVLKHTTHEFDIDREGKDTWRYRRAGAQATAIMSSDQLAVIRALDGEPGLDEVAALLGSDLDVILAEGFKRAPMIKIEIVRAATGCDVLTPADQLLAVVTDCELKTAAPQLAFESIVTLADLIVEHTRGDSRRERPRSKQG